MFLCRTGRLSAAALDQAFKAPGSFLVKVKPNRPGDVTVTVRTGHTFQRHRVFCASAGGVGPPPAHLREPPQRDPVRNWDASAGFISADWAHSDRVAAVAANLSKSVRREGGALDVVGQPLVWTNRRHNGGVNSAADVLFTGNWGVSSRHCATMQTRSSSTKAATKKSDAAEEQTDGDKGDVQTVKEASTTSSTGKDPMDTEPEGGKPNKTQQLKKVFKEYGAVGVSFHVGISLMSLGMFYLLISSGIDMAAILCKLGFSEAVVESKMAAGTSTFVLSYAIHKLFAPVRISITLVSVPLIVRYFRKTGLFKPPTPAP
ncbi:protein FAM210B, mitochondrial [Brachyistius frenatus]|uniref:protein FAM210B, mitochondrial n=1 Tax=Brachyistius frenatus TaxID=100188 RepID=UPI0037E9A05D